MKSLQRKETEFKLADFEAFGAWKSVEHADAAYYQLYEPFQQPLVPNDFEGIVIATYVASSGDEFVGTLESGRIDADGDGFSSPLYTPHQIWYRADGAKAWASLLLGRTGAGGRTRLQENRAHAVKALGLEQLQLFPMVVRPHVPIEGFPAKWSFKSFALLNQDDEVIWMDENPPTS